MGLSALRRGVAAADIVWTAWLFAAAYVAGRADPAPLMRSAASLAYVIGGFVCHQKPERSFHLWGAQLAVCARCAGIYVGAAMAALAPVRRRERPALLLGAASTPAVASLVYEWVSGVTPSNWARAATGLVLGAAVMAVLRGELRSE